MSYIVYILPKMKAISKRPNFPKAFQNKIEKIQLGIVIVPLKPVDVSLCVSSCCYLSKSKLFCWHNEFKFSYLSAFTIYVFKQ